MRPRTRRAKKASVSEGEKVEGSIQTSTSQATNAVDRSHLVPSSHLIRKPDLHSSRVLTYSR